jgi:hypothetical protein
MDSSSMSEVPLLSLTASAIASLVVLMRESVATFCMAEAYQGAAWKGRASQDALRGLGNNVLTCNCKLMASFRGIT